MTEPSCRRILLCAWCAIGALLLASIGMLPPALTPDADTPLAIDAASGEADASRGSGDALAAVPAPRVTLPDSLPPLGYAAGRPVVPGRNVALQTALPTRAPPR